ncbi:hypothetical protein GCM10027447_02130 [Glycomyces halotolerans]
MLVLITVKAAPNPSEKYGETVCVAGLRINPERQGWVRLYPLNFRELERDSRFKKYSVLRLKAQPARSDGRRESWRPDWESVHTHQTVLAAWNPRRRWIDEHREGSMCRLNADARVDRQAKSLALIVPAKIDDFEIEEHPGWTAEQQRKLDKYLQQDELPIPGTVRRPPELQAPKFKGFYRYTCHERGCNGHRQQILDWEFVALQRHLAQHRDDSAKEQLRAKFLDEMCAPDRDTAFYVGNMAARPRVFSALGVYWPRR